MSTRWVVKRVVARLILVCPLCSGMTVWILSLNTARALQSKRTKLSNYSKEIPQSRSTAFPRHQRKKRWRTNQVTTNAIYEFTNAQTKKYFNIGTALERSVEKLLGDLNVLLAYIGTALERSVEKLLGDLNVLLAYIGTALERSVEKLLGGLNVLLAPNLALNSYAVPNYKYIFWPHMGPLLHLCYIAVKKNI